jgi:phage gpG-like protein
MYVVVEVRGVEEVLALFTRIGNPEYHRLLSTLGLTLEEQTINHFAEQAGPEGPWPPTRRGGTALVDTGRLRGSITHAVFPDEVRVGTNVHYGKYHQMGTSRIPRRMFLGPSEKDKSELQNVIESFIARTIAGN